MKTLPEEDARSLMIVARNMIGLLNEESKKYEDNRAVQFILPFLIANAMVGAESITGESIENQLESFWKVVVMKAEIIKNEKKKTE